MTTSPAYCSTEPPNAVMPARLLEEGGEEGLQTLRIVAGGQLGRADKVGEEDCDGLALPEGRT